MTNETQQTTITDHKPPAPFGTRLKAAREALGLDRKDAAAQLRLNEKVIIMMEKDRYPIDLPVTFIRGYIRAYGKLLQIPEYEIKKAIEPIKPKQVLHDPIALSTKQSIPMTSGNYFMQFFTYLIVITMVGLVGIWWYTHTTAPANPIETQLNTAPPESPTPTVQPPAVVSVESTPTPPPSANSATSVVAAVQNNSGQLVEGQANTQSKPIQNKAATAGNAGSANDPYADDDDYSNEAE